MSDPKANVRIPQLRPVAVVFAQVLQSFVSRGVTEGECTALGESERYEPTYGGCGIAKLGRGLQDRVSQALSQSEQAY